LRDNREEKSDANATKSRGKRLSPRGEKKEELLNWSPSEHSEWGEKETFRRGVRPRKCSSGKKYGH